MNIIRAFHGFRKFGLKGTVDWLRRTLLGSDLDRALYRTRITQSGFVPTQGITIVGDFSPQNGSLCKVLGDLAAALARTDVPHQVYDTSHPPSTGSFAINRYTHIIGMLDVPDTRKLPHCQNFRIVFWEFESGLLPYYPHLADGAPILCLSDFCTQSIQRQVPSKVSVYKLLYPFYFKPETLLPPSFVREKYHIPESDFCVFYNFDYHSGLNRKNPEAVLRAFARAFANQPGTKLVLKTMRAKMHPDSAARIAALARELNIESQLVEIQSFISNDELVGLTNACDVYVSLHRGEGFGLGIAEAMSLGKPVIVSDYSSTTEFCHADNAILIPCKMVAPLPTQMDVPYFQHVDLWADPDVDAAADALKKLYKDKDYRQQLGKKAKAFIEDYFSTENFKKSVEAFLNHKQADAKSKNPSEPLLRSNRFGNHRVNLI